jgi:FtsH-binding integral membrane protein
MNFSRFYEASSNKATTHDAGLRDYMIQVYNYMCLGLALTAVVALIVSSSPTLLNAIHGTALRFVVMFAPLGVVLALGFKISSLKFSTAKNLFWLYAGLMGLSLSYIFIAFTGASIARTFFITSSMFGFMSIYGYSTKKDLTSMGSFLMMGVFGIIILSLINIFLKSSGMSFIISIAAIVIFVGLTAYDTQKIKQQYFTLGGNSEVAKKAGLMGALTLYIDFINIFIHLLHLIGERR